MKKTILSIALLFALGSTSLFAADGIVVNRQTATSFNKQFAHAKDVRWQIEKEYYAATFILNGQVLTAYFNDNAKLISVVHNISPDQLPASLLSALKEDYTDYWITGLSQESVGKHSYYMISIENADQSLTLKSAGILSWSVEQTKDKNLL